MATDIIVPPLGESVTEATVARWLKSQGDAVAVDDPLVELETDKVTLEVNAPAAGTLAEILVPKDANVSVGGVLGRIADGAAAKAAPAAKAVNYKESKRRRRTRAQTGSGSGTRVEGGCAIARRRGAFRPGGAALGRREQARYRAPRALGQGRAADQGRRAECARKAARSRRARRGRLKTPVPSVPREVGPLEQRVRMTRLRRRIAERLKEAQNTAAMLTTFNEADMTEVMALRERYRAEFEKKHGVRLGFMSFFVKACIVALKEIPSANGEIDGDDIIYKNHYDIGVAVGTEQGLVVPVLRDADHLDFAEIEKSVADLGRRARDGKLKLEELSGGTFTITNGGVYGSLMSTPILNPPQSAILGMHKIQKRPVVVGDQIVARPMMYLALSYDHRLVDGREAVTFLVRVKECIEDPERLLFSV